MIWGLMIIFAPQQHDRRMTEMGHERPICHARGMSTCPSSPDISLRRGERRKGAKQRHSQVS